MATKSEVNMKKGSKRPYYGTSTKREVTMQYELGRTSTSELAELHGILGSNTISNWQKEFRKSPVQEPPVMGNGAATILGF